MPGSPKKRAKRAAAEASHAQAGARATVQRDPITPVAPNDLPTDAQLVAIAKGVLLGVALGGAPADQVKAAWQLADVARRTAPPVHTHNDLDTMPSEELELLAAQAQAQLHGERQ